MGHSVEKDAAPRFGKHEHEKCCRYLHCAHPTCCGYRGEPRDTAKTSRGAEVP